MTEDKRAQILKAAHDRFLHYGVNKTTMRDVADDVGIAVSNLYRYFENKREIVLAIAQVCREEQDAAARSVLLNKALLPPQKLETFLLEKYRFTQKFRSHSTKGRELLAYLVQEFPERFIDWQKHLEETIAAILVEGCETGSFEMEDPGHHAHMLRISTTHFFLPDIVELPLEPREEELRTLVRWFLSMVAVPNPQQVSR